MFTPLHKLLVFPDASASPHSHLLLNQRDLLGLNLQAPFELDLDEVQQAYQQARRLSTTASLQEHATLVAQVQHALAPVRGPFLDGFWLGEDAPFDTWREQQQQQWQVRLLLLFDRLSSWQDAAGEWESARATLTRWVALDPLAEEAYQRLMRVALAQGDAAAAVQVYTTLQARLAQALQIAPSPETVSLAEHSRTLAARPKNFAVRSPTVESGPQFELVAPLLGRTVAFRHLVGSFQQTQAGQPGTRFVGDAGLVADAQPGRDAPAHRGTCCGGWAGKGRPGSYSFAPDLIRDVVYEADAMLSAIFSLPHSAQLELPDVLYTLTEGNPFFIEEILTSLVTAGDIVYVNGHWDRKRLRVVDIPRSVQDAVQQRTDRLSENARQVVLLAAVAGRRFDFALLQELTQHDERHLLLLLKELIAAQLLVEESTEQFAFRHALTREALYAQLLIRERKALHRSVAATMEHLSGSSLDAHVADLAYHFFEAGVWEKALAYGQRAGEQAQALYAPQAATLHFTRALDAAGHVSLTPPASLYRARGLAYETLGEFERARADHETALQLTHEASDRHGEWQALLDLGFLWAGRAYAQTGDYYQRALALARTMDDPAALAHSLNRLGNWHLNIEQPIPGYNHAATPSFASARTCRQTSFWRIDGTRARGGRPDCPRQNQSGDCQAACPQ